METCGEGPIYQAFKNTNLSPRECQESKSGKATFVSQEGEVRSLTFTVCSSKKEALEALTGTHGSLVAMKVGNCYAVTKREELLQLRINSEIVSELLESATYVDPSTLDGETKKASEAAQVVFKLASEKAQREFQQQRTKEKHELQGEQITAQRKTRAFHIITGLLETPVEMALGLSQLVIRTAQLGALAIALPFVKGADLTSKRFFPMKPSELSGAVLSSAENAVHQVKIALLQMIPVVGGKLANAYRSTGSLSNFLDAPAIGGILEGLGLSPAQLIYNTAKILPFSRSRRLPPNEENFHCDPEYLNHPNPTIEDARQQISKFLSRKSPDKFPSLHVRIPFTTDGGKVRYHDGTMLFGSEPQKGDAKTVVIYHGNGETLDSSWLQERSKPYLTHGYNVLIASYAGDHVVQGHGHSHKQKPTQCSERAMIEDARADVHFLYNLGVREVAIEGYSLGGAQAMNFAQAVTDPSYSAVTVTSIVLDRTFTSAPEVSKNFAINKTGNGFLGELTRGFVTRSVLGETRDPQKHGCDGLDSQKKLEKVVQAPSFSKTKLYFLGANNDEMMSRFRDKKPIPGMNFADDLYETALQANPQLQGRVKKEILQGDHITDFFDQRRALNSFLFSTAPS